MAHTPRRPITAVVVVGGMIAGILSLSLTQTDNQPCPNPHCTVARP